MMMTLAWQEGDVGQTLRLDGFDSGLLQSYALWPPEARGAGAEEEYPNSDACHNSDPILKPNSAFVYPLSY